MTWYNKAQVEEDSQKRIPGYPYYLAVYRENRFKGQYPQGILGVPSLQNKWDRGDFGVGRTTKEIKSENMSDVLNQLRREGLDPRYNNVDFYVVPRPNSPRRKMQLREVLELSR
jgi:hypothetical protein